MIKTGIKTLLCSIMQKNPVPTLFAMILQIQFSYDLYSFSSESEMAFVDFGVND